MKIIDDTIFAGLRRMRESGKSNIELAKLMGLSTVQVSKLLNRKVSHFNDATWARVRPLIKPYVEADLENSSCKTCPQFDSCIFKILVKNLLDVPEEDQSEFFDMVNEFVLKKLEKYRKQKKQDA